MDWTEIKHFKPSEFDSPDLPGSGQLNMSLKFVAKLDILRDLLDKQIIITSGFRTYAHNKKVKGQPNSAHLRGFAADIRIPDSAYRFDIIKYAFAIGFNRFEDAPAHIHLDDDLSLPRNVFVFLPTYPV